MYEATFTVTKTPSAAWQRHLWTILIDTEIRVNALFYGRNVVFQDVNNDVAFRCHNVTTERENGEYQFLGMLSMIYGGRKIDTGCTKVFVLFFFLFERTASSK